jgi:DNA-binding NarL/FixJ family response regulator
MTDQRQLSALLIEDHELVRHAVGRLLSNNLAFSNVYEADDLAGAMAYANSDTVIDLVMVDLNLPDSSGPDGLTQLIAAFPDAQIAVMSGSEMREDVLGCLSIGVDGYIPKGLPTSEFVAAIATVIEGGSYIPRHLTRRPNVEAAPSLLRRDLPELANLTPRQIEVVDELLHGQTSKEIARKLDVAEGTVKIHLAAIYRVLGVRTRGEAISKLMAARG